MKRYNDEYSEIELDLFPELRSNYEHYEDFKRIKTITFQVTEECSLRCTYCYQGCKSSARMTFDVAKKFIDKLFEDRLNKEAAINEYNTAGIIIDFIGGEPLLEIDLITQIADYFDMKFLENLDCSWSLHHCYSICSNGIAYFDPKVQEFINNHKNFISINITIDGCKELHDKCRLFPDGSPSYDIAIKAALDLLKQGHMGTKITQAPDNISYTFAGIKNMLELGFKNIMINPVYEEGWELEHAKILYDELKKTADYLVKNNLQDSVYIREFDDMYYDNKYHNTKDPIERDRPWCGSTSCMYALDYKGEIYPCIRFMNSSLNGEAEPYSIGNIECGIGGNSLYKDRIDKLSKVNKTARSEQKCLDCPVESGCGGCLGYEYQHFGNFDTRATYICAQHRAAALASKYFYKLCKNRNSYDKIEITWDFAKDIINEEEWNSLKWERD